MKKVAAVGMLLPSIILGSVIVYQIYSYNELAEYQDSALFFSSYFGGDLEDGYDLWLHQSDFVSSIVDENGSIYIVGTTYSDSLPTTANAFNSTGEENLGDTHAKDGFILKVDENHTLVYCSYFGGTGGDYIHDIYLDQWGQVIITGTTYNSLVIQDFPTTLGALYQADQYKRSGFVTVFTPDLENLNYSTKFGGVAGNGNTRGMAITTDSSGNIIVVGNTDTPDFDTTVGVYDTTWNGDADAFITKFDPDLGGLVFSTYLGTADGDYCFDVELDADGNLTIMGSTYSRSWPTTPNVIDPTHNDPYNPLSLDPYLAKIEPDASNIIFSTYYGSTYDDFPQDITIDASGDIWWTFSESTYNSTADGWKFDGGSFDDIGHFCRVNSSLGSLEYATDYPAKINSVKVDERGVVWVAGSDDIKNSIADFHGDISSNALLGIPELSSTYHEAGYLMALAPDMVLDVERIGSSYTFDWGTTLLYGTYIFGDNELDTHIYEIHPLDDGSFWIVGSTEETSGFPLTSNALAENNRGNGDLFITHFKPVPILQVSGPSDFTYSSPTTLTWSVLSSLDSMLSYTFKRGEVVDKSSAWTRGEGITGVVDLEGVISGVYNYTVTVTDSYGSIYEDTVRVTVDAGLPSNGDLEMGSALITLIVIFAAIGGGLAAFYFGRKKYCESHPKARWCPKKR